MSTRYLSKTTRTLLRNVSDILTTPKLTSTTNGSKRRAQFRALYEKATENIRKIVENAEDEKCLPKIS